MLAICRESEKNRVGHRQQNRYNPYGLSRPFFEEPKFDRQFYL